QLSAFSAFSAVNKILKSVSIRVIRDYLLLNYQCESVLIRG
ncbi:unnamed protein product, partial [marine sediment metagenome]